MQGIEKSIINNVILRKYHLSKDSKIDYILQITEDLCGLHATGTIEPYIQLFVRMNHFIKEDLDTEPYIHKTLGRIRGMRKTLFILAKELMEIVHPIV
jgi:hypothetical protein